MNKVDLLERKNSTRTEGGKKTLKCCNEVFLVDGLGFFVIVFPQSKSPYCLLPDNFNIEVKRNIPNTLKKAHTMN